MRLKKAVTFSLIISLGIMLVILLTGLLLPERVLLKLSGDKNPARTTDSAAADSQAIETKSSDGTQQTTASPAAAATPGQTPTASPSTTNNTNTSTANNNTSTTNGGTNTSAVAPTLTLAASPTSITAGGSSVLSWSVNSNATQPVTCTASGGWSGTKATSGSQSVTPASTTSYSLTCTNSAGSSGAKIVSVSVNAPVSQCKAGGVCTAADIASHNTNGNCWMGVTGTGYNKTYVITSGFNSSHQSQTGKNAASSTRTCGKVISIGTLRGYAGDHSGSATIGGQNFSSWLNSFYYAGYQ